MEWVCSRSEAAEERLWQALSEEHSRLQAKCIAVQSCMVAYVPGIAHTHALQAAVCIFACLAYAVVTLGT